MLSGKNSTLAVFEMMTVSQSAFSTPGDVAVSGLGHEGVAVTLKLSMLQFLITDDIQVTMRRILNIPVQMAVGAVSIVANIINILIFLKIGLSDSVTVALFGLALADLGFTVSLLVYHTFEVLDATVGLFPFEPLKLVAYHAFWCNNLFSDTAVEITVFAAVQKCACVSMPFIFRNVFTNFRARLIVACLFLIVLITYIPVFASPGNKSVYDFVNNRTRLGNYFVPRNKDVFNFFHWCNRVVLPCLAQVVMLLCTIILCVNLKKALRNRQSLLMQKTHSNNNNDHPNHARENSKELQAIQTVSMISAIFVVCNLPDVLITLSGNVADTVSKAEDTFKLCSAVADLLAVVNSAINILVYLKYNSKYRRKFVSVFSGVFCRFSDQH